MGRYLEDATSIHLEGIVTEVAEGFRRRQATRRELSR